MSGAKSIEPGMKIGRWTVICLPEEETSKPISGRKWLCRCDCGTERPVLARALLYIGSESCGCLRREKLTEKVAHDLTGKYSVN